MKKRNKKIDREFKEKTNLFLLLTLPIFIITFAIYLLPEYITQMFYLNPLNPNIFSIVFSHYTHSDLFHLLGNFLFYLLLIFLLIFFIETDLNLFKLISFLNLFVLPFVLSCAMIACFKLNYNIVGMSGIVSAFAGYFVVALSRHILHKQNIELNFNNTIILSFFFLTLNLFIWLVFMKPSYLFALYFELTIAVSFFLIVFFLIPISRYVILNSLRFVVKIVIETFKKYEFKSLYSLVKFIFSILVFIFTCFFLFSYILIMPKEFISADGGIIGVPSHHFGYAFGFIIPILIIKFFKRQKND